jgi:regulator of protease activity HflC (stomatin/prohibitin superfamily)
MKRLLFLLPLLLILLLAGCGQLVPPGYVGIKVNQLGSQRGVQTETLSVGRHYIGAYATLHLYPTFIQQYAFTKGKNEGAPVDESFQFSTKDGVVITQDVAIQAAADPALVTTLFQTYRVEFSEILHTYVRQDVRNLFIKYASSLSVDDIYGTGKNDMLLKVQADLKALYAPKGLIIDSVSYIGPPIFPDQIVTSIHNKQQAEQDALTAKNKVATKEAEAEQAIATARGEAEANRIVTQSLSQELIQYYAVQKWNGVLPTVTGNAIPLINLPQK